MSADQDRPSSSEGGLFCSPPSDDVASEATTSGNPTGAGEERQYMIRTDISYEPSPSAVHGIGLFATRRIKPGQTIISKHPLLTLDWDPDDDDEDMLDHALEALRRGSDEEKIRLWGLVERSAAFPEMTFPGFERFLQSRSARNNHQLMRAISKMGLRYHVGLGETSPLIVDDEISLVNHSCTPNAELSITWATNASYDSVVEAVSQPRNVVIRATRLIPSMTEITIPYVFHFGRRGFRNDLLEFRCRCSECTLGPGEYLLSEHWRDQMRHSLGAVFVLRNKYGMDRHASALNDGALRDFTHDTLARDAITTGTQVLSLAQHADMESAILAHVTDALAVILVALAKKATSTADQSTLYGRAMAYKIKEARILIKCLGKEHHRTRETLDQLPDLAIGSVADRMYNAFVETLPQD